LSLDEQRISYRYLEAAEVTIIATFFVLLMGLSGFDGDYEVESNNPR
jgi:hypothetical protein